jgi:hypothetical protein
MKAATMIPIVALALGFGPASADVVVRRDGTRLTGTIANHGTIVQSPCTANSVSILIARADSTERVQIPVGEIAYVIFDDGSVFAPVPLEVRSRGVEAQGHAEELNHARIPFSSYWSYDAPHRPASLARDGGTLLTIVGVGMLSVGLLVYGVESGYAWLGHPDTRLPTVLVVGGGAMTVAGVFMISSAPGPNALRDPGAETLYAGLSTRF